jgi:hypothetical protein
MMEPYREQERERQGGYKRDERTGLSFAWLDEPVGDPITFTMRDMLQMYYRVRQKQAEASGALFYWSIWCAVISAAFGSLFRESISSGFTSADPCVLTFFGVLLLVPYLLVRRLILKQIEPP